MTCANFNFRKESSCFAAKHYYYYSLPEETSFKYQNNFIKHARDSIDSFGFELINFKNCCYFAKLKVATIDSDYH